MYLTVSRKKEVTYIIIIEIILLGDCFSKNTYTGLAQVFSFTTRQNNIHQYP